METMNLQMKNKEFVLEYFNAISGKVKTLELLQRYINDALLLQHIAFFDGAFPKYEMFADEMTADGNRVVVRARVKGKHEGVFGDIQPTYRTIEMPFVIGYTIENQKIVSHWLIADQMALMEQLGAAEPVS